MNVQWQMSRLGLWIRSEPRARHALPYALLALSTVLSLIFWNGQPTAQFFLGAGLVVLAAGWMLWMVDLHPAWKGRPRLMRLFFAGLLTLMAALVLHDSWFGFYVIDGYVYAFRLLRGAWRVAGLAPAAVIAATSQHAGLPGWSAKDVTVYVILIAINLGIAGMAMVNYEQSERRRQTLTAVAEANARLEASLRENAGLHAQLLAQAREAGIQDERQRMAREIHDTLAQGFTGIIAQLEAAKRFFHDPELWSQHVDQAQRLARESLVEARRSVQALQPEVLDAARLPEAIADMAQRWSQLTAVPATFETTGEPLPLLAEIEVTLLRVAQEALHNVAKHAHASRVGLTLSYMDDVVLLDVRDDGMGFDVEAIKASGRSGDNTGFGLAAMRQRMRQVAGTIEIESSPGAGTAINATVPALPAGGRR